MEKVAVEGASSLMIFRKSASAKLKKTYKDKLDTNSAVDFNDMNVHVAALLLKVYILCLSLSFFLLESIPLFGIAIIKFENYIS